MEDPTDADVDAIIEQCGGDAREAVRVLLATLGQAASHGFLRRRVVIATKAQDDDKP